MQIQIPGFWELMSDAVIERFCTLPEPWPDRRSNERRGRERARQREKRRRRESRCLGATKHFMRRDQNGRGWPGPAVARVVSLRVILPVFFWFFHFFLIFLIYSFLDFFSCFVFSFFCNYLKRFPFFWLVSFFFLLVFEIGSFFLKKYFLIFILCFFFLIFFWNFAIFDFFDFYWFRFLIIDTDFQSSIFFFNTVTDLGFAGINFYYRYRCGLSGINSVMISWAW